VNGWDLFTWFSCAALAGSALVIFGFFLRDVGDVLRGQRRDTDEE
jgi:hypothetical protein